MAIRGGGKTLVVLWNYGFIKDLEAYKLTEIEVSKILVSGTEPNVAASNWQRQGILVLNLSISCLSKGVHVTFFQA